MNKYYFEKLKNEGEANKKTEECFWMNVEASDNVDGNYLSMGKLFSQKENQNVFLSNEWQEKLGKKIYFKNYSNIFSNLLVHFSIKNLIYFNL